MTATNIRYSTTLIAITCGHCGIPFGLPADWQAARVRDAALFYCPNGHRIGYGESEADKERKKRERAEEEAAWLRTSRQAAWDQAQAAERRRAAAKGQLTKVKKRVANGVCPCCNRTFPNLADHMETKHPNYVEKPADA